jgi:hypothetical protein
MCGGGGITVAVPPAVKEKMEWGTKSYKICDIIYHVMVISEIYDKM